MSVKKAALDKAQLEALLEAADRKWFSLHNASDTKYREHLAFTAEYLAKHYKSEQA